MASIEEQFNMIASEYDSGRKKFISCFNDFYESTTNFIAANIEAPARILDLGAGTGLLSYFWYRNFPKSEYVLVDLAEEMLSVAGKRFAGLDNFSYEVSDYTKSFPDGEYDCIVSALSIHHLDNESKSKLFSDIYCKLPDRGIFVNYDQFCGGSDSMDLWFDTYWENRLESSGLTQRDIELWKERRKLDRECTFEEETEMLKKCGFSEVKCIYTNQKFSVIVSIK